MTPHMAMADAGISRAAREGLVAALTLRHRKWRRRGWKWPGGRRFLSSRRAQETGDTGASGEGDEIINILKAEMERKRRGEEELEGYVEQEKQKLREVAEEVRKEPLEGL